MKCLLSPNGEPDSVPRTSLAKIEYRSDDFIRKHGTVAVDVGGGTRIEDGIPSEN
jgi:hypothetical protein